MTLSKNEEDYLKALFHLIVEQGIEAARTKELAAYLDVAPASVNAMLKKLKLKGLVEYEKYGKLQLSLSGQKIATQIIRKHRLWETFLYKNLNFNWEEVHEVAEQLEHIQSEKLINELDKFLGFPKIDPHGSPIPSSNGDYQAIPKVLLSEMKEGNACKIVGVKEGSIEFLKYFSQIGLVLSSNVIVEKIIEFDNSMLISFEGKEETISQKFAANIFVEIAA